MELETQHFRGGRAGFLLGLAEITCVSQIFPKLALIWSDGGRWRMSKWAMAATWPFGKLAVEAGIKLLDSGRSGIDAIEQGISLVEVDPNVDSVGVGGIPNLTGEVELDAAFMRGVDLAVGAVASVKGFPNPIRIARLILEKTPHHILVGEGAERFADSQGLKRAPLLTGSSLEAWEKRRGEQVGLAEGYVARGHDTIGVVALDQSGGITAGTSTSGMALKLPGRVGDSPLVGSGFYADDTAGAAVATGCGELIMRGCLSYGVVELMRAGASPQEACADSLMRLIRRLENTVAVRDAHEDLTKMAVVAIDRDGNVGAAANHGDFDFAYSHSSDPVVHMVRAPKVS